MWPIEIEKLKQEIQNQVESTGAWLVDFSVRRGNHRSTLTIVVDKPEGIKLDECADINRKLGAYLEGLAAESEAYAFLKNPYFLEVNSPGLDRPIKTKQEFERVIGKAIRVLWQNEHGITVWVEGKLRAVLESGIQLDVEPNHETKDFLFEKVVRAVRNIQFS